MTPAGFPHSEILGSQLGWQLPEAYRSLLRPSSAPGAKASTVRPYKLGHKVFDARVHCAVLKLRAVPAPEIQRLPARKEPVVRPEGRSSPATGRRRETGCSPVPSGPNSVPGRLSPSDAFRSGEPDVLATSWDRRPTSQCSTLEQPPRDERSGCGPGRSEERLDAP